MQNQFCTPEAGSVLVKQFLYCSTNFCTAGRISVLWEDFLHCGKTFCTEKSISALREGFLYCGKSLCTGGRFLYRGNSSCTAESISEKLVPRFHTGFIAVSWSVSYLRGRGWAICIAESILLSRSRFRTAETISVLQYQFLYCGASLCTAESILDGRINVFTAEKISVLQKQFCAAKKSFLYRGSIFFLYCRIRFCAAES